MAIHVFQTQIGQTDGFCHRSKSIPCFPVKLCARFRTVQHSAQFLWCWHCALSTILMTVEKRSGHLDPLRRLVACGSANGGGELSETSSWFPWGSGQFDQNAPQLHFSQVPHLWHTQAIALVKRCSWKLHPETDWIADNCALVDKLLVTQQTWTLVG